jgi:asparagine synthase (glutamine-hydrolysing)
VADYLVDLCNDKDLVPLAPPSWEQAEVVLNYLADGSRCTVLRRSPRREGWPDPAPGETLCVLPAGPEPDDPWEAWPGGILQVDPSVGAVRLLAPLADPSPLYYIKRPGRLLFCSDPRVLAGEADGWNEAAFYSLLQYGAVIPPVTPWRGLDRLAPGHAYMIDMRTLAIAESVQDLWRDGTAVRADGPGDADEGKRDEAVRTALDDAMRAVRTGQTPVILFSGGVDSGLLAARAAHLGWRDTLLLDYAFGPDDPEAANAELMARHLGLPIRRIECSQRRMASLLGSVGSEYRTPFTDSSILPAHDLCQQAIEIAGRDRTVLNGIGPDSLFGALGKRRSHERVFGTPLAARRLLAMVYASLGMWRRSSSMERAFRAMRRSLSVPLDPFIIGRNSFDGVFYRFPDEHRQVVRGALASLLTGLDGPLQPEAATALVEIVHFCSAIVSQKGKPVFDAHDVPSYSPYLTARLMRLALRDGMRWPDRYGRKACLRRLLTNQVPESLVARPKSGFTMASSLFRMSELDEAFGAVHDGANPLAPYLRPRALERLRGTVRRGDRVPDQTLEFFAGLTICSLWFAQVARGARLTQWRPLPVSVCGNSHGGTDERPAG